MASKLKFDAPKEEPGRKPAGEPSVPISGPYTSMEGSDAPSAPISSGNIDLRTPGLKFDPPSEAQKSVARIREITGKLRAGEPYAPGPADYIADQASLSTVRPMSAAITAGTSGIANSYPGSSYDERYKAMIQYMNERAARAEHATPFAPVVGAVAQIPATMTGAGNITRPASTLKVAGQAAIPGAIEGASQNAGSVSEALEGGVKNAALSASGAAVLDKGMKVALPAARRGAEAETRAARGSTPDEVRAESKTFFQQLDNNGIAYSAQQTAPLYTALHGLRNTSVYSPRANPGLADHFDDLLKLTRQGATFNQLHDIRSAIAAQARGPDESTRRAAGAMLGEIDRMVNAAAPAINPGRVNVPEVYGEAKRLWRAASLADDAGWIADKTERKMAAKSGVDPDATTRGNFAALEQRITRNGAYDPYTDQQRDLLSRIVRGDRVQNAQAATGDFLKRNANKIGIGAGAATSAAGLSKGFEVAPSVLAAGVGLPVSGAANLAGTAFKSSAASRGQENVSALLRDITGSPKPIPGDAITRDDLAKILFAQDLERLAPRVGSAVIGNQPDKENRP